MLNRRDTLLLALATLPMTAVASPQALTVYVGGYAPKCRGIHRFHLDPASGALTPQDLTPNENSPSWLALDANRRRLYSANEGDASVSAYALAADGALQPLGRAASGGAGPVHLSLHPAGRHLFVANYGGATVAVLPLLDDGRPGAALDVRPTAFAPELRPGPQRAARAPEGSFAISGHDAPHAHMAASDPGGRFLIACDLGLDLVIVWRFDAASGRLSAPQATPVSPGAGPRHFVFHPQRPELVYVLNEEASTLSWLRLDAAAGRLVPLGEVSALPAGFKGTSFASGLLISPDGQQLYSLNRLHDSIAIFDLRADGAPRLRGLEWARGSYPRSAALDASGRWLLVCNQNSDHVAVFERSSADGGLRFAEQYGAVGSPAAVVFG